MKRRAQYRHFIFSILAIVFTSCSSISKLAVRYECPSSSGIVIDDYTGKPIVGATVQVLGSISHPRFPEGSVTKNVCLATVKTDEYGIYTIPAWTNEVGMAWDYYEQTLILKPGQKPIDISADGDKGIPPHGPVVRTVTLRQNSFTREELFDQEKNIFADVPKDVLSDSLLFYTSHRDMVENGRLIDARDPSIAGYIRPKPELVVTRIKSFSVGNAFGDKDYHTIAITLFPADAKKLVILTFTRAKKGVELINQFVVMLGDKPVSFMVWADYKHLVPAGYILYRDGQGVHEIVQALQKLVQRK